MDATMQFVVDEGAHAASSSRDADDAASSCQHNYVVTAQKPTVVTHSCVGNFTSSEALDLIVAKSTRLEVYRLTANGLKPMLDVPLYGRVATMSLCKGHEGTGGKSRLFFTTERYGFSVLSYDEKTEELKTEAFGDVRDNIGRPAENGQIGVVDEAGRAIGLQLYDGLFKVIPAEEKGSFKEAFNIRLEELQVIDIQFLHGTPKPTIAVLYKDMKEAVHIKTYEIGIREKEFLSSPWAMNDLDRGSSIIIPVPAPLGGVVVLGEQTIVYLNKTDADPEIRIKPISTPHFVNIVSYGAIDPDGSRYLLGDHDGTLYMLVVKSDGQRVQKLSLERLGETSIASTLNYLDNGVVYVGSAFGNSQLIKLHAEQCGVDSRGNPTYVEVLEEFINLGPIVDMCVVDLERHGQGQVVTCSGAFKDGSLRVVRNGIGIDEQAVIQLPGVKGLFSLKDSDDSQVDKYLVVTFVNETRILGFLDDSDTLDETEIAGFNAEAQTLCCGNMVGNTIVQATQESVRLVSTSDGKLLDEWKPDDGSAILSAKSNPTQIVVSSDGGKLFSLSAAKGKLKFVASTVFDQEIACLDCTPMNDGTSSPICAVGLWSMEIVVASMSDLKTITRESMDEEVIPRSTLLCSFEDIPYLLIGLGDGQLVTYLLDEKTGALSGRKKLSLGSQPISLQTFKSHSTTSVFAASDRPTVIYSNNKKLIYSNVNVQEVLHACPLSCNAFPDALALASEEELTIGGIDDIQKLHIRSIPLGAQPRRIAYQPETKTYAVVVDDESPTTAETEVFVKLFNECFDQLAQFQLEENEFASALKSVEFAGDSTHYYAVGTAISLENEDEPSRGRILILKVEEDVLTLVAEKEVRGAVYNLNEFKGKLLAGINSKLELFRWKTPGTEDDGNELVNECSHHGHIIAYCVATRGDWILVGDLMKSVSLLLYKPEEGAIDEMARDFNANWMTAIEMFDDDETYLGAENNLNFFTVARNSNAMTDEERSRLEIIGEYHVGEFVNVFARGSLVMSLRDGDSAHVPTLLFGTGNGVVGVLASLPKDIYDFTERLQTSINVHVQGVGGLKHADWRSFRHELRGKSEPARNFVDGDLIECFLDLRLEQQDAIAADLALNRGEIIHRVEELIRLTH